MRFEHLEHLLALWTIPALVLLTLFVKNKRNQFFKRIGKPSLLQQLFPGFSPEVKKYQNLLLLVALVSLIIAWANPQWGSRKETGVRKSADILIALDVSQSMLAEDVQPSRLEKAKKLAENLITNLKGERIGLILFAGDAFLQLPLTNDYAAASLFIKTAHPEIIPTQGTAMAQAIRVAEKTFSAKENLNKALILITDGENHDEKALAAVREAREKGLFIFGVGLGTTQGAPIPLSARGGTALFKKDENGKLIISKFTPEALQALTDAGNGKSYHISAGETSIIKDLKKNLEKLDKVEYDQQIFSEHESYFQVFMIIALLLLLSEFFLPGIIRKQHKSVTL